MDNFAKCFGYDTENPAYQAAIQNAAQQGLPQDGTQPPVENIALSQTVETISSHDTAPPPLFPTVSSGYAKKAGKAVFTFSKHPDDELRSHLGNCLLAICKSSGFVTHKWQKGDNGNWDLRIKAKPDDPRIVGCLQKIRTLMSNCEVLGHTGEKFVAGAKKIQTQNGILNALCEPSVTFYRDQNGDVCAITHEDEAS
jgi:hypothetical protein